MIVNIARSLITAGTILTASLAASRSRVPLSRATIAAVGIFTFVLAWKALPLLVVFLLFQRQIVQGIANTGLKG